MDELIERYINYLRYERNASPHTVRNYRSDLLQFRDYLAAGLPSASVDVKSVDALGIRGFLGTLFEKQEKKSSIARKLSAVRAFFKFLRREGVLAENPSAIVSTPKAGQDPSQDHDRGRDEHVPRPSGRGYEDRGPRHAARPRAAGTALRLRPARERTGGPGSAQRELRRRHVAGARQGTKGEDRAVRLEGQAGPRGLPPGPAETFSRKGRSPASRPCF